jgi:hypothetical protein
VPLIAIWNGDPAIGVSAPLEEFIENTEIVLEVVLLLMA